MSQQALGGWWVMVTRTNADNPQPKFVKALPTEAEAVAYAEDKRSIEASRRKAQPHSPHAYEYTVMEATQDAV